MAKKKTGKSLSDLESLYDFGENPKGFTAQTANGTSKAISLGWNQEYAWDKPEATPGGPWKKSRSNRSGE